MLVFSEMRAYNLQLGNSGQNFPETKNNCIQNETEMMQKYKVMNYDSLKVKW